MTLLVLPLLACGPKKAPAGPPTTANLTGTTWTLHAELDDLGLQVYDVTLAEGGRLEIHNERDTTTENDFWSFEAGVLTLSMNDSYVVYTGTFSGPDALSGTASNVRDESWGFQLER